MKTYNKLVRDKIPEIIEASGKLCVVMCLSEPEFLNELNKKMQEELNEYLASGDIEELVDIEEVLRAILDVKKVSYAQFEKARRQKVKERGAFKLRAFLASTTDGKNII